MKLTARQIEVLQYIRTFHERFQYMPTTRDIADHFRFRQSAAVNHIKAIEAKGYIKRTAKKARALSLTRTP